MAVSVNYTLPATGAVAPTAAQVASTVIATVTATADADTTATITHNLGVVPLVATLTSLLQASAALSGWAVTAITSTTATLTKSTSVGSGNAGAQVQVMLSKPHSLFQ